VLVSPGDVAADHASLLVVAGVVGAVQGKQVGGAAEEVTAFALLLDGFGLAEVVVATTRSRPTPRPPSSWSPASRRTTCFRSRSTSPPCWTAASACPGTASPSWTAPVTAALAVSRSGPSRRSRSATLAPTCRPDPAGHPQDARPPRCDLLRGQLPDPPRRRSPTSWHTCATRMDRTSRQNDEPAREGRPRRRARYGGCSRRLRDGWATVGSRNSHEGSLNTTGRSWHGCCLRIPAAIQRAAGVVVLARRGPSGGRPLLVGRGRLHALLQPPPRPDAGRRHPRPGSLVQSGYLHVPRGMLLAVARRMVARDRTPDSPLSRRSPRGAPGPRPARPGPGQRPHRPGPDSSAATPSAPTSRTSSGCSACVPSSRPPP
jgi:hypothetical protein